MSPDTITKSLDAAIAWLYTSKIQNISGDQIGGVNGWILENGQIPFIYSEITGYAISTFLSIYKYQKEQIYLDRALLALDWLQNKALVPEWGYKTRYYYTDSQNDPLFSFKNENMCTFDTGMILNGLMNLYKTSGDNTILQMAIEAEHFIVSN